MSCRFNSGVNGRLSSRGKAIAPATNGDAMLVPDIMTMLSDTMSSRSSDEDCEYADAAIAPCRQAACRSSLLKPVIRPAAYPTSDGSLCIDSPLYSQSLRHLVPRS
jgi:hypothetical protein